MKQTRKADNNLFGGLSVETFPCQCAIYLMPPVYLRHGMHGCRIAALEMFAS